MISRPRGTPRPSRGNVVIPRASRRVCLVHGRMGTGGAKAAVTYLGLVPEREE